MSILACPGMVYEPPPRPRSREGACRHESGRIAPRFVEARCSAEVHRRLEPGFGFRALGRLDRPGRLAEPTRLRSPSPTRARSPASFGRPTRDARQSLGGGAHRSRGTGRCSISSPSGRRDARANCASRSSRSGRCDALAPFLFVPRGGPWPLEHIGRDRESDGIEAENTAQHRLSLRRLQRLLCALARPGHGLHLRLFPRLERRSRHRATAEARHDLPQAAAAARGADARHRQRLGLARLPCGAALRRAVSSA